jgi:gas vesicle protein
MNRVISFMSGAVMGALVGATLAILFTPASGGDLRVKMQEQVQRIQEEVKTATETRRTELEEQLATLRKPQPAAK